MHHTYVYYDVDYHTLYLMYFIRISAWCAIKMLTLVGLQVISVAADGAPNNRRFIRINKIPEFQCSGVTL